MFSCLQPYSVVQSVPAYALGTGIVDDLALWKPGHHSRASWLINSCPLAVATIFWDGLRPSVYSESTSRTKPETVNATLWIKTHLRQDPDQSIEKQEIYDDYR